MLLHFYTLDMGQKQAYNPAMNQPTSALSISYLSTIPEAKEIIVKHLQPTYAYGDIEPRLEFMGSPKEMYEMNMGGGIPHDVIVSLMSELDSLNIPPRAT